MRDIFLAFPQSFKFLWSDKKLRTYAILPIIISFLLYIGVGFFFFASLSTWVNGFISSYFVSLASSTFFGFFVSGLMFILFILMFNWTFVLVVNLLSSPFNALISDRIEDLLRPNNTIQNNMSHTQVIINELKKISVSILLTIAAATVSIIPLMGVISLVLSALIVAFTFLDFSWSRHGWSWDRGLKDLFNNFFYYLAGGFLFLTLISVPFINLLVPVWGTSYFTILWLKKN